MSYPKAIVEKAKRIEHLLQRVQAGEPFDQVCADLKVKLAVSALAKVQEKYEAGGRKYKALIDGRCGHPQKAHSAMREWLYARKVAHPQLAAYQLAKEVTDQFDVKLSIGHINYLLRRVGLAGPRGRPRHPINKQQPKTACTRPDEVLENAGLFFPRRCDG